MRIETAILKNLLQNEDYATASFYRVKVTGGDNQIYVKSGKPKLDPDKYAIPITKPSRTMELEQCFTCRKVKRRVHKPHGKGAQLQLPKRTQINRRTQKSLLKQKQSKNLANKSPNF